MKILIGDLNRLKNDDISVEEAGLMLLIILLKDDNPKIHLAKIKARVNFKNYKQPLIKLHEKKLIKWSGYRNAIKSLEKEKTSPEIHEIIEFMNKLYKRKFNPDIESTVTGLRNRLEEYSIEEIKLVISNRYKEWKDDPVMEKHLNPGTIFRPSKFSKYIEEAKRTRVGESLVNVETLKLKDGQEITFDISKSLINSDTYNLTVWILNNGKRIGTGRGQTMYGKEIKRQLKLQENKVNNGGERDFQFIFKL